MLKNTILCFVGIIFVLIFLAVSESAHASSAREKRKFGLGLEGYQGNFGVIHAGINATKNFRVALGYGSGSGIITLKGGLKWLFINNNFSPYIGAEFWRITGTILSIKLSSVIPVGLIGIDHTFDMGLNLGAGAVFSTSSLALGMFYVAYYF